MPLICRGRLKIEKHYIDQIVKKEKQIPTWNRNALAIPDLIRLNRIIDFDIAFREELITSTDINKIGLIYYSKYLYLLLDRN